MEMALGPECWLMSGEGNAAYVVCFGCLRVVPALSALTINCELIRNDLMASEFGVSPLRPMLLILAVSLLTHRPKL